MERENSVVQKLFIQFIKTYVALSEGLKRQHRPDANLWLDLSTYGSSLGIRMNYR